ncbi:siderophore-interacting protein [Actinomadura rayongensis]|uniref:SIP domain-containing protein n=1 Tax=Actinomadura rayongensis TaxID=1429076 RepID=A0A6I4WH24_9ACTN|nr:siderophore-interacting protein [Actinomadura rayongensis]MXQ68160.1 SIP domain-containing protein [Actinomadura rayongensis]
MSVPSDRVPGLRVLTVLRAAALTPRMRRITLGGPEVAGFGTGPNVKLLFPPSGDPDPQWPTAGADGRPVWPPADRRPVMRTYTVRRHDPAAGEVDVDFVLHGDAGVASRWAAAARPGDVVGALGPGGRVLGPADHYVIAGDQTALPAIGAMIENLPAGARGQAVVEVPGPAEVQHLMPPPGVELTWLFGDGAGPGALAAAVRALPWPDGDVFAWVAGESASVRAIRSYVRDERGLPRGRVLAIGYWKRGLTETAYHDAHDNDRDADYYAAGREEAAARA